MVNAVANQSQWAQATADERFVVTAAEQGNLWKAFPAAAGVSSAAAVVYHDTRVGIVFGTVSAGTTLSLRVSADGMSFVTIATITLGAASDFAFSGLELPGGIQLQLVTSGAVTITATALI